MTILNMNSKVKNFKTVSISHRYLCDQFLTVNTTYITVADNTIADVNAALNILILRINSKFSSLASKLRLSYYGAFPTLTIPTSNLVTDPVDATEIENTLNDIIQNTQNMFNVLVNVRNGLSIFANNQNNININHVAALADNSVANINKAIKEAQDNISGGFDITGNASGAFLKLFNDASMFVNLNLEFQPDTMVIEQVCIHNNDTGNSPYLMTLNSDLVSTHLNKNNLFAISNAIDSSLLINTPFKISSPVNNLYRFSVVTLSGLVPDNYDTFDLSISFTMVFYEHEK